MTRLRVIGGPHDGRTASDRLGATGNRWPFVLFFDANEDDMVLGYYRQTTISGERVHHYIGEVETVRRPDR